VKKYKSPVIKCSYYFILAASSRFSENKQRWATVIIFLQIAGISAAKAAVVRISRTKVKIEDVTKILK
jgi:hypothetical protein